MILMHKDIPVADITVLNGTIISVNRIYNNNHYPVGAYTSHTQLAAKFLDNWAKMRCIPKDRQNAGQIVQTIGCTLNEAIYKGNGVSLTDCYWFKNNNDNLSWKDVNYFDNKFSENYVQKMFSKNGNSYNYFKYGEEINKESTKFVSKLPNQNVFQAPDFVTAGALEKYWVYRDQTGIGKRYGPDKNIPVLIKFGKFGKMAQERNLLSANEVIASGMPGFKIVNAPVVDYWPLFLEEEQICGCETFIENDNMEFVNALQLQKESIIKGKADLKTTMKNIGLEKFFNDMLAFDFIIGNTDRHEKNFGIIRNPDTLEIISIAPLFDNGTSLGWDGEYDINNIYLKPFNMKAIDTLSLIDLNSIEIPDPNELCGLINWIYGDQFCIPNWEHAEAAKQMVRNNIDYMVKERMKHKIYT